MNLYRFITTFCIVPTTDVGAIVQRIFAVGQRFAIIAGLIKAISVVKSVLVSSLNIAGWLVLIEEIGRKILGIIGIGGAVASGGATVAQMTNLLESIADPQAALLDYIHGILGDRFSLSSLVSSVDSTLSGFTSYAFDPAITLTYMLQVTAVGECFNQLLMSTIQNAVFVFSIFLVRWAFRQNFTFVKSVPGKN